MSLHYMLLDSGILMNPRKFELSCSNPNEKERILSKFNSAVNGETLYVIVKFKTPELSWILKYFHQESRRFYAVYTRNVSFGRSFT